MVSIVSGPANRELASLPATAPGLKLAHQAVPGRPALAVDDCPLAPALDDAAMHRVAAEHYDRGSVLYSQGEYDGAVRELVARKTRKRGFR